MATHAEVVEATRRPRRLRRRLGALVVLIVLACLGFLFWTATSIRSLPIIAAPFDVDRHGYIAISDDENAYTFYRRAHELIKPNEPRTMLGYYPGWDQVAPGQLEYLESNREALNTWFEGTKRDRGVYFQPRDANADYLLPVCQTLRRFLRLANLEAIRLEHEGDLAGSWTWIRANLRASRHSGQYGFWIEWVVGRSHHESSSMQAMRWSDQPGVDAAMLRCALDDVLAVEAIITPPSNVLFNQYFDLMNTLDDPGMRERAVNFNFPREQVTPLRATYEKLLTIKALLLHEPERSRRVGRLVLANWLSVCDLPSAERRRRLVLGLKNPLYEPAPGETSPIAIEELDRWYESTYYMKEILSFWKGLERSISRDEKVRAGLIVHLAEQLYKREHGEEPADVRDLIGPYLKRLPVGYAPPVDEATFVGPPQ
jgi:hypothetical protein